MIRTEDAIAKAFHGKLSPIIFQKVPYISKDHGRIVPRKVANTMLRNEPQQHDDGGNSSCYPIEAQNARASIVGCRSHA